MLRYRAHYLPYSPGISHFPVSKFVELLNATPTIAGKNHVTFPVFDGDRRFKGQLTITRSL